MKHFKLFIVLLMALAFLPMGVFAKEDKKVNLYLFRGEGCPHCQEAEEFFDSIKDEYGKYYNLVDYEVWYNEDNAKLMEKVAKYFDQEVSGVPYIIIGSKTWSGYTSEYDKEIKAEIKSEYAKTVSDRTDVIKEVKNNKTNSKKSSGSDVVALIIIVIVVCGAIFGVIKLRKQS